MTCRAIRLQTPCHRRLWIPKADPVPKQLNEITEENLTSIIKSADTTTGTGVPQPYTTRCWVNQGNITISSSWFHPTPEAFAFRHLLRRYWAKPNFGLNQHNLPQTDPLTTLITHFCSCFHQSPLPHSRHHPKPPGRNLSHALYKDTAVFISHILPM